MAEAYKNDYQDVTAAFTDTYECPAATSAIVKTLRATNVDSAASHTVQVKVLDSDGSTEALIAYNITIPAGASLELCGDSLIFLEAGDKLQALADSTSAVEIFVSALQIT